MKPKQTVHRFVPKVAFAMAGGLILAMTVAACQFDPQPVSSVPESVVSEPLPSLIVSDLVSSQPDSQVPSVVISSQASSAPPVSSAAPKPVSSVPAKPASSTPPAASSAPVSKPPSSANDRIFDDAVFIGNSFYEDLHTYGGAGNADFYYRVGLTVRTVFTKPTAKGSVPVIDELKGRSYGKVILMFGENELGWSADHAFEQDYGKLIDAVHERQPNAVIYINSLLPVTKAVSDRSQEQVTNARIREYNSQLKVLAAQKGAVYLDAAGAMQDSAGNLPADAAPDGIHPNRKYCMKWLDYLRENL